MIGDKFTREEPGRTEVVEDTLEEGLDEVEAVMEDTVRSGECLMIETSLQHHPA